MSQLQVPMIDELAVDRHGLRVEEAGLVLVDLDAGAQELGVVRHRGVERDLLVRHAGHHEAHVGAARGGGAHRRDQRFVRARSRGTGSRCARAR